MDVKTYEALRNKAKPVVAKMRKGESVSGDEKKLVAEAAQARNDLWAVKPPVCYVAGTDVRKYLSPEIGFDSDYKARLRGAVRLFLRKRIQADQEVAKGKGEKTLVYGAGAAQERLQRKATREAEVKAAREAREKLREKKKAEKEKLRAERAKKSAERKESAKKKLLERAKDLGLKVSA